MIHINHPQDFNKFVKQYPSVMQGVYGSMFVQTAIRKIAENARFKEIVGSEDHMKTLNELANHIDQNFKVGE